MPRYRGVGMPRAKKKAIEQPSEAFEIPQAPPDAPDPPDPPSPDPKQTIRTRPAESPGMKTVKAAAFQARRAERVARRAEIQFLRERLAFTQRHIALTNRADRIGKEWKKKGSPGRSSHLRRVSDILSDIDSKRIHLLQTQVVASELKTDAKDALLAEKDARLARMRRLLQRRKGKVPREL